MTGVLRVRTGFAAAAALCFISVVLTYVQGPRTALQGRRAAGSLLLFLNGLSLSFLAYYEPYGFDAYELTRCLTLWFLGWGLGLLAVARTEDPVGTRTSDPFRDTAQQSWRDPVIAGVLSTIALVISAKAIAGDSTLVIDETLYVLQARLFNQPAFSLHFDSAVHPFFMLRQAVYVNGGMFSHYPLGWPAILAVFDKFELLQWAGSLLGAMSVVMTYLLGRRLYSARVGAIAAALLALHPHFLLHNNRFWSHAGSTLCIVVAAYLIAGARSNDKPDRARWIGVGVCLGICLTIRPLTAVGVGLSLAIWYVIRSRAPVSRVAQTALWTILGILPFILATLLYNQETTGAALTFAYTAAMNIFYGRTGIAHEYHMMRSEGFGGNRLEILWTLVLFLLPAALLVPFLRIASRNVLPFRKRTAAAFLVLPVVYLAWNYSAWRFYLELFPFALIAVAALYEVLRTSRPAVARAIAIYMWILLPVTAVADTIAQRRIFAGCREATYAVADLAKGGPLLVFAAGDIDNREGEMLLECLYVYNTRGLNGPVVVARDLGAKNSLLMKRYPDYRSVRISWNPKEARLVLSGPGG